MRNKKHGIIALFISIYFFSIGASYIGFVLASIGILLLNKWRTNPLRQLEAAINNDAKRFHAQVPTSYPLKMDLVRFYSKYSRLSVLYPALKTTYNDLLESMWKNLATAKDKNTWKKIIDLTDKNWPEPVELQELLKQKLNTVRKETKLWEEAIVNAQ